MPEIVSLAPQHLSNPVQVRRSSPGRTLPSPRARGAGQVWGSRNALSTRETEQTGSLMESNQSQALESPIAMAAEFSESDKAHSPSLPARPCPPRSPSRALPVAALRARSDGLITVKTKR